MTDTGVALQGDVLAPPVATEDVDHDAHKAHAHIIYHRARADVELLQMGAWLLDMHERKLYLRLGYETWPAYLADPHIGMSKETARRYMGNWQTYGEKALRNGQPIVPADTVGRIGMTKADIIAPDVRAHPEQAGELVALAEGLTTKDLRREISSRRGADLTAVQEQQDDLGAKLVGIAAHLRHASDPLAVCHELYDALLPGWRYLGQLIQGDDYTLPL